MGLKLLGLFHIGLTFVLLISANGEDVTSTPVVTTLAPITVVTTVTPTTSTLKTTPSVPPTTTTVATTTPTPEAACHQRSGAGCEACVNDHSTCYYCETNGNCTYFSSLIPGYEVCGSLGDVKWATCKINFKVMIIATSTVGGLLILGLIVCCCCCCKKRRKGLWSRDQAKWDHQREELKMRSDERKKERQSRTDQIRRKYGLMKDDTAYQRFDA